MAWLTIADVDAYGLRIAPERKLMDIRLTGSWTVEIMARYERDWRRAMLMLRAHGCRMNEQATLIDATGYPVQPPEVAAAHERIAASPETRSDRVAVIATGALLKMQATRVAPTYRIFASREEAMAWLLAARPGA